MCHAYLQCDPPPPPPPPIQHLTEYDGGTCQFVPPPPKKLSQPSSNFCIDLKGGACMQLKPFPFLIKLGWGGGGGGGVGGLGGGVHISAPPNVICLDTGTVHLKNTHLSSLDTTGRGGHHTYHSPSFHMPAPLHEGQHI